METAGKYSEIEQLDIMELEEIVKQSPWFSYARHLLLVKLKEMGDEVFLSQLKQSAIFLSSREALYNRVTHKNIPHKEEIKEIPEIEEAQQSQEIEEDTPEQNVEEHIAQENKPKRKIIVAGADFFSKEELASIPQEENMELKLKGSKFYRETPEPAEHKSSIIGPDGKVNYEDLAFFTETLGHIYAQQGYYEQAIEVFSKLILLYPQKSAYFATLIKEIEENKDL